MNIEIWDDKKIVFIQKQFFNDLENMENNLKSFMNGFKDYSLIINERGESYESTAFGYSKFNNCLNKLGITNRVFVFTESETDMYLNFIKEFDWTPITYYGFLMTQDAAGEWDVQLHIPQWLFFKEPVKKEISFIKKFLTFNRNYKLVTSHMGEYYIHPHRMDLYNFLKENDLLNTSYASFKFIKEFDNNFGEEATDWEITHELPFYLHEVKKEIWDDAFLHIVTESKIDSKCIIQDHFIEKYIEMDLDYMTEKTAKAVASNMPFVIIGASGLLKRLHKLGFKTFGDFWDESYDDIEDYNERLEKIKEIIKWVASKNLDELKDIYNQMIRIFEHNKTILFGIKDKNKQEVLKHIPTYYN